LSESDITVGAFSLNVFLDLISKAVTSETCFPKIRFIN